MDLKISLAIPLNKLFNYFMITSLNLIIFNNIDQLHMM